MSKTFLAYDGASLRDHDFNFYDIGRVEYWKRRVQFWKYRKHRTMGRPILMLWHPPTPNTLKKGTK